MQLGVDSVAENASGSGFELSFAAGSAYEQLQISMKSLGIVYVVSFQRPLEAVMQSNEDISTGVHAVICDPP